MSKISASEEDPISQEPISQDMATPAWEKDMQEMQDTTWMPSTQLDLGINDDDGDGNDERAVKHQKLQEEEEHVLIPPADRFDALDQRVDELHQRTKAIANQLDFIETAVVRGLTRGRTLKSRVREAHGDLLGAVDSLEFKVLHVEDKVDLVTASVGVLHEKMDMITVLLAEVWATFH